MVAVIAAAFAALCGSAATPADMMLASRCANAAQALVSLRCSLAPRAPRVAVPDFVYLESKALYLMLKSSPVTALSAKPVRRYATRKAISVADAAAITGLGRTTIKRLDRDPKNTNYPGRNVSRRMLAAWARLYREGKLAAREVRAANRPSLGHIRC